MGGAKTITIIGEKPGLSISGMTLKCEVVSAEDDGKCLKLNKEDEPETMVKATFEKNQKTTIILSAPELAPTETNKDIELQFSVLSDDTPPEILLVFNEKWNIKNNSNTNLKEVLEGKAVFAYDTVLNDDHKGETTGDADEVREVDFIQELLNQVVPRKRSVASYNLLKEDGYFGALTANAVKSFKQEFKVDNTTEKSDFQKLVKDYSLTESEWTNQIIGKKILMGKDAGDNQINGSTEGDTGLYELYDNVVKVFVKKIIEEAERYAGSVPTDNWWSRTGEGPETQTLDDHGTGMSYCYGGKNSIGEFNSQTNGVSKCMPETQTAIDDREGSGDPDYRGNINENIIDENYYCAVGGGNKKWPGLIDDEYNVWANDGRPSPSNHRYNPHNWAGIDCSGLIQRVMVYDVPGTEITIPPRPTSQNVEMLFTVDVDDKMLYFEEDLKENIKKGDLVRYGITHVSIVHSGRWGVSTMGTDYDVIHAFGWDEYNDEFSRKVIITGNDITAPTGFGRIKLWN